MCHKPTDDDPSRDRKSERRQEQQHPPSTEGDQGPIDSCSRAFLTERFTTLRDDLAQQMREGGKARPDPERSGRHLAIYDALMVGLAGREPLPDDEQTREYVAEMAAANDRETEYEQVALEHRAFVELIAMLETTR